MCGRNHKSKNHDNDSLGVKNNYKVMVMIRVMIIIQNDVEICAGRVIPTINNHITITGSVIIVLAIVITGVRIVSTKASLIISTIRAIQ